MTRVLFFGSAVLCVLCIGMSQVPDPSLFGMHDETGRLLYYGGTGLLAGLSGLVAVISGITLAMSNSANISHGQRRSVLVVISIVVIAAIVAFVIRSSVIL